MQNITNHMGTNLNKKCYSAEESIIEEGKALPRDSNSIFSDLEDSAENCRIVLNNTGFDKFVDETDSSDSRFGNIQNMTIYTLEKIFATISSYNEIDKSLVKTIFSNFNKKYTKEEEEYLKNKYPFRFDANSDLEGALFELHEIYNLNRDILIEKGILDLEEEKKEPNLTKLFLSKIPNEILEFMEEFFIQYSDIFQDELKKLEVKQY